MILTKEQVESAGVYIFWLGNVCQYVGSSGHCIGRAAESSHEVRVPRRHVDYDRVEFKFTQTETLAKELEHELALVLKPKYGRHLGLRGSFSGS